MCIDLVEHLLRATLIDFVRPRGNPIHPQHLTPPIKMCAKIMCLMPISDVTQCVQAHAPHMCLYAHVCAKGLRMTTNSFQGCFSWQPLPWGVAYPLHVH